MRYRLTISPLRDAPWWKSTVSSGAAAGALACAVAAQSAVAGAAVPPRYRVTDLGTLGGPRSAAYDINDKSQVVGSAEMDQFAPPPFESMLIRRAFIWDKGLMTALPPLPAPEPYYGAALAINDAGHIVGTSTRFMFFDARPVIWHNGTVIDMGLVPGTDHCQGNDVNDDGVVVGSCMSDFGGSGYAFRWSIESGQTVIMGPLQNEDATGHAIDSLGRIVGGHGPSVGAYVWQAGAVTSLINGPFGAAALSINHNNQIVGWASGAGFTVFAFRWSDGTVINLGSLGESINTRAHDINNNGWIVGASTVAGFDYAVVWVDGAIHDLNDSIPQASGWVLQTAEAINDKNEIVGSGISPQGLQRGYLLTPIGPGDVNGDGVVNVADLLALINSWGQCPAQGDCFADFNNDGIVNVADLLLLIENWG